MKFYRATAEEKEAEIFSPLSVMFEYPPVQLKMETKLFKQMVVIVS